MISRYLVIALALGAAAYRLSQGAVIEGIGLLGLGGGLLCLKFAPRWQGFRRLSLAGFALTGAAMIIALYRIWAVRAGG